MSDDPDPIGVTVAIESEAPPGEIEALSELLSGFGVDAEVSASYHRRGVGDLPWVVLITVPGAVFLKLLATDAYNGAKSFIQRLYRERRARSGRSGSVLLRDLDSGLMVLLEPDLPPEAYEQLGKLDLTRFVHGPLRYNLDLGAWRSPW